MKAAAALTSLAIFIGCNNPPKSSKTEVPIEPAMHSRALDKPDVQIDVLDASIEKEKKFPGGEDQRPFEVVTGHLKNNTQSFIGEVWIEVHVVDKATNDERDTTVIKMSNLRIPPHGVVGFSREVRLVVPSKPWTWTYNVISAVTDPEV